MDQKRFPLARVFSNRKHCVEFVVEFDKAVADMTASMAYIIRATSCEGSPDGRLCPCCKQLSKSLEGMNRQATKGVEIHGNMHVTAASVQLMGPIITAAAVSAIFKKKDGQINCNLEKLVNLLRDNMKDSKFSQFVEHDDDRDTLFPLSTSCVFCSCVPLVPCA
jgi:hypothetical protein